MRGRNVLEVLMFALKEADHDGLNIGTLTFFSNRTPMNPCYPYHCQERILSSKKETHDNHS